MCVALILSTGRTQERIFLVYAGVTQIKATLQGNRPLRDLAINDVFSR
jgi:hypothetical protein